MPLTVINSSTRVSVPLSRQGKLAPPLTNSFRRRRGMFIFHSPVNCHPLVFKSQLPGIVDLVLLAEFPSPSKVSRNSPCREKSSGSGVLFFTDEAVPLSRREYSSPPPLSVLNRRGCFCFLRGSIPSGSCTRALQALRTEAHTPDTRTWQREPQYEEDESKVQAPVAK